MYGNILFTMDLESALPYSSKDALCVVGGATILRGRTKDPNWFIEEADASAAANAQKHVTTAQYRLHLLEYPSIEKNVFSVVAAPTHVHLKHCQSQEKR